MNTSSSKKALLAGVSGTALQWYDFSIFGYFAPIIATTYFPSDDPVAALLRTFSVFAVGFLLAPLGALLFGYIGDKIGRKRALTISILTMAIPTALISIIPSYQSIGIMAPALVTLLRMMQGCVAGSEYTGSAIFLVEHAQTGKKALYGCLSSSAYSIGSMLAGLAASLFTASFMPEWGWRLGFALALVAGIVIFYFRIHVSETPEYQRIASHKQQGLPLLAAIKNTPYAFIGVMGLAWFVGIMTYGTYVFTATYVHTYFQMSLSTATLIITFALLVDALLEPFIALLADKIGFLKIIQIGTIAMLLLSIPVFYLISTNRWISVTLGLVLMSVLIAIICAPLNAYMVTLFPPHYRYSGFSVAFNTSMSLFGGTAPLIMMELINTTGILIAPAWYYIFGAVIGLLSLTLCEYSQNKIPKTASVFS